MHTFMDKNLKGTLLPTLINLYLFMTIRERLQLQEKKSCVYVQCILEQVKTEAKVKGERKEGSVTQETGQS